MSHGRHFLSRRAPVLDPSAYAAFFSPWQSCAKELWSPDWEGTLPTRAESLRPSEFQNIFAMENKKEEKKVFLSKKKFVL